MKPILLLIITTLLPCTVLGNSVTEASGPYNNYRDTADSHFIYNKQLTVDLLSTGIGNGNTDVIDAVVGEECLQHNSVVPNGVDSVINLFSSIGPIEANVKHIIAHGELVFAHVHYITFNQAGADIFRFKDGLMVEH